MLRPAPGRGGARGAPGARGCPRSCHTKVGNQATSTKQNLCGGRSRSASRVAPPQSRIARFIERKIENHTETVPCDCRFVMQEGKTHGPTVLAKHLSIYLSLASRGRPVRPLQGLPMHDSP